MITRLLNWKSDAATVWFYVLTGLCATFCCLMAAAGGYVLQKLQAQLTEPQMALACGMVLIVQLQCGIGTMLVMIFYDPKRRRA